MPETPPSRPQPRPLPRPLSPKAAPSDRPSPEKHSPERHSPEPLSPEPLSIVIVETDPVRAGLIADSLRDTGPYVIATIPETAGIARRISEIDPDIVLIDMASPSRDMLEEMALASGPLERPVAMFVDRSDDGATRAAIDAGVSAYVVDGLRGDRIKPIMEAAIARFQMVQRMRVELETTRRALEERKVIDRAKGLLMKARTLDEDAAYALLRRTAMDQGKRVADVAQALVTAADLLS